MTCDYPNACCKRLRKTSQPSIFVIIKVIVFIQKQKVSAEKGTQRICQNEEEHRRQWDEAEKAKEEVMLADISKISKISIPGEEENPEKV